MFDLEAFKVQSKIISAKPLSRDAAQAGSDKAQLEWIKANRDAIIHPIKTLLNSIDFSKLPKGLEIYTQLNGKISFTYRIPNTSLTIGDFL